MAEEVTAGSLAHKAIRSFDERVNVRMKQAEWDELHRQIEQVLVEAFELALKGSK